MNKPSKNTVMSVILWCSILLAMLSSMHHLADQFGWLERLGNEMYGWAAAVAIDASILVLTYGLRTRKKANRSKTSETRLWVGIIVLTFISISANFLSAISNRPEAVFQAIVFSATLPIVVILLSDIASSDDEKAAKKSEQVDERVVSLNEQIKVIKQEAKSAVQEISSKLNAAQEQIKILNAQNEQSQDRLNEVQDELKVFKSSDSRNGWHDQWAVYLNEHPDATQREIAEAFKVSVGTVNNRLKELKCASQN